MGIKYIRLGDPVQYGEVTTTRYSQSTTYSLKSTARTELDEVLGIGGGGSYVGISTTEVEIWISSAVLPRVNQLSASAAIRISPSMGVTRSLSYFNQTAGGGYQIG